MEKLVGLALLPGIVLMAYIYKKDNRDKEPFKLLFSCFLLGVISVIPAIILELLYGLLGIGDGFVGILLECIFGVALIEEGCKYVFLKLRTWKNPNFDYSFDGIVYSVFVSLGFATCENVMYVIRNGFGVGIMRALTAVPGHMCFAVLMGYFYSGMRFAKNYGDNKAYRRNLKFVLLVPILVHGFYDAFAMSGSISWIFTVLFFVLVILMFIFCFRLVNKASKNDMEIALNPVSALLDENAWMCPECKVYIRTAFCGNCGSKRPN